ncbi:MAG: restriction endonuclease subunit S [Thermosphaera sp.]
MTEGPYKLPKGWRWVRLGEACEINPRRPRLNYPPTEPTTFVPMAAVNEETGQIVALEERPFEHIQKGYTYFEEGDVLFAKITPCMENGKAAIARGLRNGFGFGSSEFHVLRPKGSVISEWVWLFVRREGFRKEVKQAFRGGVGQQRVPQEFLEQHLIPLPPLEEQRRIVARIEELMGRIREARRLREEAKQEAERLWQAVLAETFPRPGSPLPPGWHWVKFGEIFHIQQGASMSPKRRHGVNPLPFLRAKNVQWGFVDLSELDQMDFSDEEVAKLALQKGDLLVCEGGEVGRCAIWQGELSLCLYQNHVHCLRATADVEPKFYMYWMQVAYQIYSVYVGAESRTAIPNLSKGRLKEFIAPFPPLAEQRRIAGYLEAVHEQLRALKEAQAKTEAVLKQVEQAILDRAFRGEL